MTTELLDGRAARVDTDGVIAALAAGQHGVVARWQLIREGVPPHDIEHRAKTGRLRRWHRGVFSVGPVAGPLAREMAAVLACGPAACVSHASAAALWGLMSSAPAVACAAAVSRPAEPQRRAIPPSARSAKSATLLPAASPRSATPSPAASPKSAAPPPAAAAVRADRLPAVDVTTRSRPRPRAGIRVHQADLRSDEVTLLDGVPVTTTARTLLDLAGCVACRELERALAQALRQRLASPDELDALLERYPRRAGSRRLRALLAGAAEPALTRSEAEDRFLGIVRKARLRAPEVNVVVSGFEVDFFWRAERLVVEIDGFAFHSSSAAFEADRSRDGALVAAGLRGMRVTWRQLDEPEVLIARLAQALVRRD
jgi:very-short-patch-repair endonuclease